MMVTSLSCLLIIVLWWFQRNIERWLFYRLVHMRFFCFWWFQRNIETYPYPPWACYRSRQTDDFRGILKHSISYSASPITWQSRDDFKGILKPSTPDYKTVFCHPLISKEYWNFSNCSTNSSKFLCILLISKEYWNTLKSINSSFNISNNRWFQRNIETGYPKGIQPGRRPRSMISKEYWDKMPYGAPRSYSVCS